MYRFWKDCANFQLTWLYTSSSTNAIGPLRVNILLFYKRLLVVIFPMWMVALYDFHWQMNLHIHKASCRFWCCHHRQRSLQTWWRPLTCSSYWGHSPRCWPQRPDRAHQVSVRSAVLSEDNLEILEFLYKSESFVQ